MTNSWTPLLEVTAPENFSDADTKATEKLNREIRSVASLRQKSDDKQPILDRGHADPSVDRTVAWKARLAALRAEAGVRGKIEGFYAVLNEYRAAALEEARQNLLSIEEACRKRLDLPESCATPICALETTPGWRRAKMEVDCLITVDNGASLANDQAARGAASEADNLEKMIAAEPRRLAQRAAFVKQQAERPAPPPGFAQRQIEAAAQHRAAFRTAN